jgi:hypothetical protein
MSKNYIIFAGNKCSMKGGWNDFYSFAETLEEANIILNESLTTGSKHLIEWYNSKIHKMDLIPAPCDWGHIVNTINGQIIKENKQTELEENNEEQSSYDEIEIENDLYRDYNFYNHYSDSDEDKDKDEDIEWSTE